VDENWKCPRILAKSLPYQILKIYFHWFRQWS